MSIICMIGRLGHQNGGSQVALLGQIMIELIQPLWYFGFGKKLIKKMNWRWDFGRIRTRFLILVNQNSSPNDRTIFNWNRISVFSSSKPFWRVIFRTFQYFGRHCKGFLERFDKLKCLWANQRATPWGHAQHIYLDYSRWQSNYHFNHIKPSQAWILPSFQSEIQITAAFCWYFHKAETNLIRSDKLWQMVWLIWSG